MKKWVLGFCLLLINCTVYAASVLITKNGTPIYEQNTSRNPMPIASITKLMSAIVIIDSTMDLSRSYKIEAHDVDNYKHSASRLPVGTILDGYTLMHLALMSSDNRAISALMHNYPGGYHKGISEMNIHAKTLGMTSTSFVDPTGLYPQNKSTPHDLAILIDYAAKYHLIHQYTTTKNRLLQLNRRQLTYLNSNGLVRRGDWNTIQASKTGFTIEAGHCLVMSLNDNGNVYSVVVLNAGSNNERFAIPDRLRKKGVF